MQAVRRYAYLLGFGLVAALVLFPDVTGAMLQSVRALALGGDVSQPAGALIVLIGVLITLAIVKQVLAGVPGLFQTRIQRLKRRITVLVIVAALAAAFLIV